MNRHFETPHARKLIYLAITNAVPAWTRTRNWTTALHAFKIHFGERLPEWTAYTEIRTPSPDGVCFREAPRLARIARWWVAGSGRNLSTGPVQNILRP